MATGLDTARRPLLAALLAGAAAAAAGAGPPQEAAPGQQAWMAVGDATLDRLRGGFDPGTGLPVTFGISRAPST